jgi:hypothetical protein
VHLELATSVRGAELKAVIQTSDPDVARAALAAYSDAVRALASMPPDERRVLDWDAQGRAWLPALDVRFGEPEGDEPIDEGGVGAS